MSAGARFSIHRSTGGHALLRPACATWPRDPRPVFARTLVMLDVVAVVEEREL